LQCSALIHPHCNVEIAEEFEGMDGKTVHDQSNLQLRARQFGGDWLIRKEHRRWLMLAFGVFGVIDVELSALNAAPVRNALADAAWIGFAGRVIRAQIDEGPSLQRTSAEGRAGRS
jgi:hypothetical protein